MTSAVLERQYVIHVVDCSESIKIFGENQLKKCQDAQLVYKFRENSKYSKITVPTSIDNCQGYHPSCYKIFTSVSSKEVLYQLFKNKIFSIKLPIKIPVNQVVSGF
jgi:hypothetical protein